MNSILSAYNLVKTYPENYQAILNSISVEMAAGGIYCFIGSNGAGKTTLLKALAGLIDIDSGQIFYNFEILKSPSEKLVAGHPKIKFLSQDATLYPKMTVYENIRYELKAHSIEFINDRIAELLLLCGLTGHENKYPSQLSGGQKQRTALARAIADEPEIVILDEPFSNADVVQKMNLRKTLSRIFRSSHTTMLFSSHDISDAFSLADKIYCMKAGEVVQEGPPIDIYRKPKNKYVADLGSICNYFNKDSDKVHNNIESTLSCVRAIDLLLCNSTDNDFSGKIIESFYLGPNFEYTLSLKNGRNIIFYSEEILEIGKAVFLKIREGCIIYF